MQRRCCCTPLRLTRPCHCIMSRCPTPKAAGDNSISHLSHFLRIILHRLFGKQFCRQSYGSTSDRNATSAFGRIICQSSATRGTTVLRVLGGSDSLLSDAAATRRGVIGRARPRRLQQSARPPSLQWRGLRQYVQLACTCSSHVRTCRRCCVAPADLASACHVVHDHRKCCVGAW